MGKFIDLTGKKFGRLIVIERIPDELNPVGKKAVLYNCKCECGNPNYRTVDARNLKSNHTKSCGCLKSEVTAIRNKKYNTYDLSSDYGIGYLSNNEEFYFDLEDYDKIKDYCWRKSDQGYIITINNLRLHRLVMNAKDKIILDHKNRNKKDNRKSNLRVASHQQNAMNRLHGKNNALSVKGVRKRKGSFQAKITVNGKEICLGTFRTVEEAKKAREKKELELYGEFACIGGGKY